MTDSQKAVLRIIQGRLEALSELSEITENQGQFIFDTAVMIGEMLDEETE